MLSASKIGCKEKFRCCFVCYGIGGVLVAGLIAFILTMHTQVVFGISLKKIASTSLASDEIIVDLIRNELALFSQAEREKYLLEIGKSLRLSTFAADSQYSHVADFARKHDLAKLSSNNIEDLFSFRPDYIVMANFNHPAFLSRIKGINSKTIVLESFEKISDIRSNIKSISELIGKKKVGKKLLKRFDADLSLHKDVLSAPKSFLVYIGGLSFPGSSTLIDSSISHIGGVNLVAKAEIKGFKTVSKEWLTQQRPDFIVIPLNEDNQQERNISFKAMKSLKPLKQMVAKGSKVIFLEKKGFWSTSHRLMQGIKSLANKVCKHTACKRIQNLALRK